MKKTFVALMSTTVLYGCVVQENIVQVLPQAAAVKLVKEDDKPLRCKVLGEIHGTSRSQDQDKAHKGAENDIKNQAAALKANYALVEIDRSGNIGSTNYREAFLGGKALKCEDNPS
jgi:hypothetical protein